MNVKSVIRLVLFLAVCDEVYGNLFMSRYVHIEHNETVLVESWKKIQKNIIWLKDEAVRRVLPTLLRTSGDLEVSQNCMSALQKLVFGLTRFEMWALKMVDAIGKPTSGYLEGTTTSLGSYDECLKVVAPGPGGQGEDFVGQYCLVDLTIPLPPKPDYYTIFQTIEGVKNFTADNPLFEELKSILQFAYILALRFGACVPSVCTKEDVGHVVGKVSGMIGLIGHVSGCEVKTSLAFDGVQYVILIVLIIIAVVSFGCTVLDAYPDLWSGGSKQHLYLSNLSFSRQIIRVCSINHHVMRLLRPNTTPSLSCLHGIRFFTMTWVVIGHGYILVNYQLIREFKIAKTEVQKFSFQPVVNAVLSFDTFFFVTGLFLAYSVMDDINTNGKKHFNPFLLIARKLWRVFPMTVIAVGLGIMLPLIDNGPVWHEMLDGNTKACYKNWWASMLFIQNFMSVENMCMPHLWFVSVEMQLFPLALIFLLLYLRKKKLGIMFAFGMVLVSCIMSGFITYWFNSPPTMIIANPDPEQGKWTMFLTQCLPHVHMSPYAIGLLLGAFLASKPKVYVPRVVQYILWSLSVIMGMGVVYGVFVWNRGKVPDVLDTMAYSSLSRTAWALGLAWIVFACFSGRGGLVNRFMSWKAFVFFSRLTFSTYLIHFLAIWFFVAKQKTTIMGQQHQGVTLNVSGIASCFFIGFLFHVHFEGPLLQFGKILLIRLHIRREEDFANDFPEIGHMDLISELSGKNETPKDGQTKQLNSEIVTAIESNNIQLVYRL